MTLKYVILTNQFERHTVQFAIFMAFLDPQVSQFLQDIVTPSHDPFSRPQTII